MICYMSVYEAWILYNAWLKLAILHFTPNNPMKYMYTVSTGIIYGPSANFVNVFSDLGSLKRDIGKYFNRSIPPIATTSV